MQKDIVVIGIGNTLMGDDGAGPKVILLLEGRFEDVELVSLDTPSHGIITYLTGKKKAIIVDAAFFGAQPGEVKIFQLDQIKSVSEKSGLHLHDTDIVKVLEYAGTLNLLPAEITLYCIQAMEVKPSLVLSPAVKIGVQEAARLIEKEIQTGTNKG
jgi:hydrogenase maturation protease